jgi:hypothetical protein
MHQPCGEDEHFDGLRANGGDPPELSHTQPSVLSPSKDESARTKVCYLSPYFDKFNTNG